MKEKSELRLKWGTIKGWSSATEECISLLKEYHAEPVSWGAAQQSDTPHQKELILKMIDAFDTIYLDWDGKYVTKSEAKEYILNYGRKETL